MSANFNHSVVRSYEPYLVNSYEPSIVRVEPDSFRRLVEVESSVPLYDIKARNSDFFERYVGSQKNSDWATDVSFKAAKLNVSQYLITQSLVSPPPPKYDFSSFFSDSGSGAGGGLGTILVSRFEIDPENSIWRKLFACIPVIGIISNIFNERPLAKKIYHATCSDRAIELINIKNHYKLCTIIRASISMAIVVAKVSLPVISASGFGICFAILGTGHILRQAYGIYKNKNLINDLQKNLEVSKAAY